MARVKIAVRLIQMCESRDLEFKMPVYAAIKMFGNSHSVRMSSCRIGHMFRAFLSNVVKVDCYFSTKGEESMCSSTIGTAHRRCEDC